jgi:hypothetical protein
MKPDNVCGRYANQKPLKKLSVLTYHTEEPHEDMVLIEGDAEALEFLGNILKGLAHTKTYCDFHFGPKQGGNIFFDKTHSTHGIYIHRLPCVDDPDFSMAKLHCKKD